jgi:hypothetical protein
MQEPPNTKGFKEWAMVCHALGTGLQSVVLRKGGIHEGANGFRFSEKRFWLFPTGFHEQVSGLDPDRVAELGDLSGASKGEDESGTVSVRYFAECEWATPLKSWQQVEALRGMHVWSETLLRERFVYTEAEGIWLAALRIYALDVPWEFPDQRKYGGCRSWLDLPSDVPELSRFHPVLSDGDYQKRIQEIEEAIGRVGEEALGA